MFFSVLGALAFSNHIGCGTRWNCTSQNGRKKDFVYWMEWNGMPGNKSMLGDVLSHQPNTLYCFVASRPHKCMIQIWTWTRSPSLRLTNNDDEIEKENAIALPSRAMNQNKWRTEGNVLFLGALANSKPYQLKAELKAHRYWQFTHKRKERGRLRKRLRLRKRDRNKKGRRLPCHSFAFVSTESKFQKNSTY